MCTAESGAPASAPTTTRRGLLGGAAATALLGVGAVVAGPAPAQARWWTSMPRREEVTAKFGRRVPQQWGTASTGVISRFRTDTRWGRGAVALTFDACGGGALGYDADLIATLRRRKVPATLFVNRRWAEANPRTFGSLASDPLFEIANHGQRHIPLSVRGWSAYGIRGTRTLIEAYEEIYYPQSYFNRFWDLNPQWFRPGTAYTDEVAAAMARYIGMPVVGFSVNGDGGATFSSSQVATAIGGARAGDIVLAHFNRPAGGTAEGLDRAITTLRRRGLTFRRLRAVL